VKSLVQFGKMLGEETREIAKSTGLQITGETKLQQPSDQSAQAGAPDLYNLPGTHTGFVDEGEIQKLDVARARQLEEEMAQIRRQKEQEKQQNEQAEMVRRQQLEAARPREAPMTASKPSIGKGPGAKGPKKGGLSNVVGRAEKGRNVSQ